MTIFKLLLGWAGGVLCKGAGLGLRVEGGVFRTGWTLNRDTILAFAHGSLRADGRLFRHTTLDCGVELAPRGTGRLLLANTYTVGELGGILGAGGTLGTHTVLAIEAVVIRTCRMQFRHTDLAMELETRGACGGLLGDTSLILEDSWGRAVRRGFSDTHPTVEFFPWRTGRLGDGDTLAILEDGVHRALGHTQYAGLSVEQGSLGTTFHLT